MARPAKVKPSLIPLLPEADVHGYIDPLEPGLGIRPSGSVLPYDKLGGRGFERLCFELLVAEGKIPHLFGKPGQIDYGADIVVEDARELLVYQCKNYTSPPSWTVIRDELLRFETEWLSHPDLPNPSRYVFACSQPLDDIEVQAKWLSFKQEFEHRTSVRIQMCGRDFFDAPLRSLPEVVAGLFSPAWAEVFCGATDWQTDPWVRICRGQARHPSVSRFLQRHSDRLIYVAEDREESFRSAVLVSRVVLVRGLPGTGKTMTTLESLTRLPGLPRPIYYATFLDGLDIVRLWQSALRRSNLPSVFVLDECHLDFARAEAFVERLKPELARPGSRIAVVLLSRTQGTGFQETDADSELVTNLRAEKAIVEFATTALHFRHVLECLRPDFIGLSEDRLSRLFHATGGDLALLDEALDEVKTPSHIDTLDHAVMCASIYRRYFGGRRLLPTVRELAALAQYDLTPPTSLFEGRWEFGERETTGSLVAELFSPPRYRFVHSSLAELVLHSLVRLEVTAGQEHQAVLRHTHDALWRYLVSLFPEPGQSRGATEALAASLQQVLRSQLKILSPELQVELKVGLVTAEQIQDLVEAGTADILIALLCDIIRLLAKADVPDVLARYISALDRKMRLMLAPMVGRTSLPFFDYGLRTLKRHAPEVLEDLQRGLGPKSFVGPIVANGTIADLFKALDSLSLEFTGQLLDELDETSVQLLVARTIVSGVSIGTLNLTMRYLRDADPDLLDRLEKRIGVARFLSLISANGTVFELFHVMQHATRAFAGQMLDRLDENDVKTLVDKTIASGRSIGSLNLAMRELGDADPDLLVRLEKRIGVARFLKLIAANGTVFELFKLLENTSSTFAGQLLDELDDEDMKALLDKTIASGRSIGTLNLAMRELGDADPGLLVRLEKCIGAARFLKLIAANGTVIELFKLLEHTSSTFAGQLLDELDEENMKPLVDKTIASARSVGTLSLTLLGLRNTDQRLLVRLEKCIGAARFLKLIAANGSVLDLFGVLRQATPAFAGELLDELDEKSVKALIDKAVLDHRSIESVHFCLANLARVPKLRERLESAISIAGWWRLLIENGTLNSLTQLHRQFSKPFRTTFTAGAADLSVADWARILCAGQFRSACMFVVSTESLEYPAEVRQSFLQAVTGTAHALAEQSKWIDLHTSSLPDVTLGPEASILNDAFSLRIKSATIKDLLGLDFLEAVNGIALLWRERHDLQEELAQNLWNILGDPADWPADRGEWLAIRFILSIAACSPLIIDVSVARLFEASCATINKPKALDETKTLPLFLLLWNLAALSFGRGLKKSMSDVLTVQGTELCVRLLSERTKARANNTEKASLMALAGLLDFFQKDLGEKLRTTLSPLEKALPWLEEEIAGWTFVPEFFARRGISLIEHTSKVFSFENCVTLLKKADNYADRGPAVEALCRQVQRYAGQSKNNAARTR
jgi:hypothetical protein